MKIQTWLAAYLFVIMSNSLIYSQEDYQTLLNDKSLYVKNCKKLGLDSICVEKGDTLICSCANKNIDISYYVSLKTNFTNQIVVRLKTTELRYFYSTNSIDSMYKTSTNHMEKSYFHNNLLDGQAIEMKNGWLSKIEHYDKGLRSGIWIEYYCQEKNKSSTISSNNSSLPDVNEQRFILNNFKSCGHIKAKGAYMAYNLSIVYNIETGKSLLIENYDKIIDAAQSEKHFGQSFNILLKKYDMDKELTHKNEIKPITKHFKMGKWEYWNINGELECIEHYDKGTLIKTEILGKK